MIVIEPISCQGRFVNIAWLSCRLRNHYANSDNYCFSCLRGTLRIGLDFTCGLAKLSDDRHRCVSKQNFISQGQMAQFKRIYFCLTSFLFQRISFMTKCFRFLLCLSKIHFLGYHWRFTKLLSNFDNLLKLIFNTPQNNCFDFKLIWISITPWWRVLNFISDGVHHRLPYDG